MNAQIRSGIEILDDIIGPIWIRSIDVESLDIRDCNQCILGQLYGSYECGVDYLFQGSEQRASDHGFIAPSDGIDRLTQEWKNVIDKKLHEM